MLISQFQFALFDSIVYGKNFELFESYPITAEKSDRRKFSSHAIIWMVKVYDVQAHGTDKTKFIYSVTAATATII